MKFLLVSFVIFLVFVIASAGIGLCSNLFALVHSLSAGDLIGHFVLFGLLALFVGLAIEVKNGYHPQNLFAILGMVLVIITLEEFSQ